VVSDAVTAAAPVSDDLRLEWLRSMITIRLFEERSQELYAQGLVPGTIHLSIGQEAVAVGAPTAMAVDDYMTVTHRCHGQALARGVDVGAAFAELMGRVTGTCRGLGGSMDLTDHAIGLIGAFSIVGAGMPVAVGAVMSAKGDGRVAVSFSGDGSANIGTFHESLNMASVWKAPVVFTPRSHCHAVARWPYPRRRRQGPRGGGSRVFRTAEVWDPVTASFVSVGSLSQDREFHSATLLPDGFVRPRGHARTGAP
jgi:TPP-dependent pyruvate/acetoin dehydrogenase alpha subunit